MKGKIILIVRSLLYLLCLSGLYFLSSHQTLYGVAFVSIGLVGSLMIVVITDNTADFPTK